MTTMAHLTRRASADNNLNALRLLAALAVLLSHCFPLTSGSDRTEPLYIASHGQTTAGHLAVIAFFAISGFLIAQSYVCSSSRWRFVLARGLRLLPGLIVVVGLLAFVIGPLISTTGAAAYFSNPLPYRYLGNAALVFQVQYSLPGVFDRNPFPSVDGALWTLRYEAGCYAGVLVLGLVGLLRWPALLGLIVLEVVARHRGQGGPAAELSIPFTMGALMYLSGMPRRWWAALVCAGLVLLSLRLGHFTLIGSILGTYVLLTFGLHKSRWLPDPMPRIGDLSYGVYIWAFPIQQIAVRSLGAGARWWQVAALSLPPALAAAWLSWHLVERRALALKPRRHAPAPGRAAVADPYPS